MLISGKKETRCEAVLNECVQQFDRKCPNVAKTLWDDRPGNEAWLMAQWELTRSTVRDIYGQQSARRKALLAFAGRRDPRAKAFMTYGYGPAAIMARVVPLSSRERREQAAAVSH